MDTFNFTQADGSSRAVRGYRYTPPKAAAKRHVTGSASVSRLPPKVDLRLGGVAGRWRLAVT